MSALEVPVKVEGKKHAKQIFKPIAKKSSMLYLVIVLVALLMDAAADYQVLPQIVTAFQRSTLGVIEGMLAIVVMLFINYFWLNGVKDVVYPLWFHVSKARRKYDPAIPKRSASYSPLVVGLYFCCNDFNGESLEKSMMQSYGRWVVKILDDSSDEDKKREIDEFAIRYDLEVIRRPNRVGFKAGNINNYLQAREGSISSWADDRSTALNPVGDAFVLIDSDEILGYDFVEDTLGYLEADTRIGVVQANHIATRNRNAFMMRFAPGVDSHWPVYQQVKNDHGFMSLLGHGAIFTRKVYDAVGGFPQVVAEDIGFSIAAREAGFLTVFAREVLCEEEFPVDHNAFKKRHNKWTQGNMEFIRTYTRRILFSRQLTWYEKMDIVLFTYALPLTAFFSLFLVINVFVFPLMGFRLTLPLWMLGPTALFLFAPMLNDIIVYWKSMKKINLLGYLVSSTMLFGSMFFVSARASFLTTFGMKSVFHVTPKDDRSVTLKESVAQNKGELGFAAVLSTGALLIAGSVLSVYLIVFPALSSIYLSTLHQKKVEPKGLEEKKEVVSI